MKKIAFIFCISVLYISSCASQVSLPTLETNNIKDIEVLEEIPVEASQNADENAQGESEEQATVPQRLSIGIYGMDHPMVEKYREFYLRADKQKWLYSVLEKASVYRPYIRKKIHEMNLPEFLEYLPLVESEYTVKAKSKSGALGLWQFMENSMKPYLNQDYFVDERLDPYKATDAALAKLAENYKIFDDWAIALAAYNCGAGAMRRVLQTASDKSFWYLAENNLLKDQSAQYVPKLIALSDIIMNNKYYGLELPEVDEEAFMSDYYDYVTTASSASFHVLSLVGGVNEKTLEALNPELYRKRTPNTKYRLRLPPGTKDDFTARVKENGGRVPPNSNIEFQTYVVQKGDTLWGISRRYGCSVEDLCYINGIKENQVLSIGQELIIQ